jgi:hypothetical protein
MTQDRDSANATDAASQTGHEATPAPVSASPVDPAKTQDRDAANATDDSPQAGTEATAPATDVFPTNMTP